MKTMHRFLALAATLLVACTTASAASQVKGTKLYKWTDENGVTHYGDTIPPQYSSQARQELNRQGVPVRELPRQLTPAEAEAARTAAEVEARRKQRDAFLLRSYTKVSDIERLRDERIALIESQMELARTALATTDQRLAAQASRLRNFRPYSTSPSAQPVPDKLASEVVRTLSERRSMETQLKKYDADKAEQQASFGADIARYRELTARK
jgi:hypothetical protein